MKLFKSWLRYSVILSCSLLVISCASKPDDPEALAEYNRVNDPLEPTNRAIFAFNEGLNQILVKQLKNRYNDQTIFKRFVVGIDRAKMRLYDCEQKAQEDIIDNGQETEYDEDKSKFKKTFGDFKF